MKMAVSTANCQNASGSSRAWNSSERAISMTVRFFRSAMAFHCGVRTGVRVTLTPCPSSTVSARLYSLPPSVWKHLSGLPVCSRDQCMYEMTSSDGRLSAITRPRRCRLNTSVTMDR